MLIFVVTADTYRELQFMYNLHKKYFNCTPTKKDKLLLGNEIEIDYVHKDKFYPWCLGKTFMFLEDYLFSRDIFWHGDRRITKEDLQKYIVKEGEAE